MVLKSRYHLTTALSFLRDFIVELLCQYYLLHVACFVCLSKLNIAFSPGFLIKMPGEHYFINLKSFPFIIFVFSMCLLIECYIECKFLTQAKKKVIFLFYFISKALLLPLTVWVIFVFLTFIKLFLIQYSFSNVFLGVFIQWKNILFL